MAALRPLLPLLLLAWRCRGAAVEVLCAAGACYTLHRNESTWAGAQERCRDNGGNLAAAGSAPEAERLRELLATARWTGPAWLGLALPRGHCVRPQEPLRGFSWAAGGEPGEFSEWAAEPAVTCVSPRCVSLRPPGPHGPGGWSDRACRSSLPAFLCKFSFQGMCGPLAARGSVSYSTPFGVRAPRLAAAPFGTLAEVRCHSGGRSAFAVCKGPLEGGGFAWHPPGPLCPLACGHRNGGCEQLCLDGPGESPRCACHPGFVLAPDAVSCLPEDPCLPNPCQGSCRTLPAGFQCSCEPGYVLAADGRGCSDVDECESGPCQQLCRNFPGGFQCLCRAGYRPAGPAGRLCHDVDECAQPHACPQLCINIPGSFRCACRPGFQRQPGGDSCLDVDECLRDPCPGACRNFPGGYECLCPPGFLRDGDGRGCSPAEAIPSSVPASSGSIPPGSSGIPQTSSSIPPSSSIIPPSSSSIPPSSRIIPLSSSIPQSSGIPRTTRIPWTTSIPRTLGMPTAGFGAASDSDGPRLLLYYIVGSLVAILLLLAFALALVACRRRAARREKPPAKSAADNYCWVPEQPEGRGERSGE
ncbi:complement component C1q receptor [Poecile atricapillus]|uniref:complement component C1q receptor n=1 Tax=Poecile atricapillus TaxID=48891 RepID=UPI00273A1889|nr:complement component C1q receptor [Poecile atricapillus]